MKRLIMCEGSNELAVVNILLENDALIFTEDEVMAFLLGGASGEDSPIQEEPTVAPKRRGRPRKNSAKPL